MGFSKIGRKFAVVSYGKRLSSIRQKSPPTCILKLERKFGRKVETAALHESTSNEARQTSVSFILTNNNDLTKQKTTASTATTRRLWCQRSIRTFSLLPYPGVQCQLCHPRRSKVRLRPCIFRPLSLSSLGHSESLHVCSVSSVRSSATASFPAQIASRTTRNVCRRQRRAHEDGASQSESSWIGFTSTRICSAGTTSSSTLFMEILVLEKRSLPEIVTSRMKSSRKSGRRMDHPPHL